MSLRRRIMLLVTVGLIAATAPLGVMGIGMLRAVTDRILDERLAVARSTAGHLDDRLTQELRQLDQLGRRIAPLLAGGDLEGVRRGLASAAPGLDLFSGGLFVADRRGAPAVIELGGGPRAALPAAAADAVRGALERGRPRVSGLVRTAEGAPAVVVTVPIPDRTGAAAGVIGGVLLLPSPVLQAFVDRLTVGTTGHAAVVSEGGIVLASSEPEEISTRGEHPEFVSRLIPTRRAAVGLAEGTDPAGRPERHVMAFAPLSAAPWGLMVGQDEAETYGPIRRLRDRVVLFGLAVLAAALLFAWLDTGAVASPLRALKDAAEQIAGGDLGRQIAVRRSDEVGALADSFETMRQRLLASLEEIRRRARASQSLYEIGKDVLSQQDRDAVLRSIVHRAAALLAADVAVLCLADESGATARVGALAGPADAISAGPHAFPLRGGEAATACLDCTVLDPLHRASHLAAPLTIGGRAVGALCVGARRVRDFSPEERELLSGLANLAAIAVENARLQERVQSLAVLEERERIAREIHDSVGQVLGYVNTKAQAVKVLLEAGKSAEAQAQLAQLEQAAREVYADLREAILGLRTDTGSQRRLIPVLREYVRRYSELSGVQTELVTEGDPARYFLSPTTELHLLRIIQEALTNVRKHAVARRAWVRFAHEDGMLTVSVRDDGQGFDPERVQPGAWPRFGLQTMRERAEAIGATFAIRSGGGSGTEVVVRLPAPQGRSEDARAAGG
jgi:nitrate/nitrite-specific signal transduction histidine kinase